jgi:hypothetical protein
MREVFHRHALAASMARQILSSAAASASSSGLFLAAPRRTGKSTFLREDLRPELARLGAIVVYADLWENRKTDPGEVITKAIKTELAAHQSGMSVTWTASHRVNLNALLLEAAEATQKTIVLIVEDIQHAITSEGGNDALFALKAARDELNSSQHRGLRIVATGSNQDKLAMLRNSKDQAFFGAPLVKFPSLGKDYVQWFCTQAELPAPLNADVVFALFVRASHRPEILGAAADALRFDFELNAADVPEKFAQTVNDLITASDQESLRVVHSLTPLQSAVLRVMANQGTNYAPFESKTIAAYQATLDSIAPESTLKADVPNVQQALTALQEKALIWRAARGVYALEESSLADLMAQAGMVTA